MPLAASELAPVVGALALGAGALLALLRVRAAPDELVVLSGRRTLDAETGEQRAYRLVRDTGWRFPILEEVGRVSLTPIEVRVTASSCCFASGGARDLEACAEVAISAQAPRVHHALERFLGLSRADIASVAAATLEGHLRAVCAQNDARAGSSAGLLDDVSRGARDALGALGLELRSLRWTE